MEAEVLCTVVSKTSTGKRRYQELAPALEADETVSKKCILESA
jgi:hypothetical protein